MKIIAFGASSSQVSINKTFASYAASLFDNYEIEVIDLNDYPLPLFSIDLEIQSGPQVNAIAFVEKLDEADLLIVSMAEHNGTYTSAFKNIFDWASRYKVKMFENKKMLLLSTSPGARGGLGVIEAAKIRFPLHGADIVATFSLPKFTDNFDVAKGIIDEPLRQALNFAIGTVKSAMS
jgi:chromate reductase, NAD(P)H dehydrogenase (quinone)